MRKMELLKIVKMKKLMIIILKILVMTVMRMKMSWDDTAFHLTPVRNCHGEMTAVSTGLNIIPLVSWQLYCWTPLICFVAGPASLSVLHLNPSELVHMRHVMVKIELDSRLRVEEVDSMMGKVEGGKVCVVCTRTKFSLFTAGSKCSVCKYSVCSTCVSSPVADNLSVLSLPSSPAAQSSQPSSSISFRLGRLLPRRKPSVLDDQKPSIMCRPCATFVQQVGFNEYKAFQKLINSLTPDEPYDWRRWNI